jgi:hypothetical protein
VGGSLTDRAREAGPESGPDGRPEGVGRWARIGLWGLLVASWVVMVAYMWDALTMVPDAARLEQTRMAVIPTPRTFLAAVAFSALELGVVLALLWPGRSGYYAVRLAGASLGLLTWFVITIPMGMSRMDWVHRRWLFFLILATAAALLVELGLRLARRLLAARS